MVKSSDLDLSKRRSVLVTGAASGIGRAVARAFSLEGWQVCGLDRQAPPADLTDVDWVLCDLDDVQAVHEAISRLRARPWSALISCAGVAGVGDPARILRVNFIAARRIIDGLADRVADDGAIVLISSGAGMKWTTRLSLLRPILSAEGEEALAQAVALCPSPAKAYELSKELLSFYGASICLNESARGVRTNVVSPGGVETPLIPDFTRSMGTEAMDFSLSVTRRHGQPQEIAAVVLFLTSSQASWINGAELRVDGGLTGALTAGVVDFPAWRAPP